MIAAEAPARQEVARGVPRLAWRTMDALEDVPLREQGEFSLDFSFFIGATRP